jgi:hypothetical protein
VWLPALLASDAVLVILLVAEHGSAGALIEDVQRAGCRVYAHPLGTPLPLVVTPTLFRQRR